MWKQCSMFTVMWAGRPDGGFLWPAPWSRWSGCMLQRNNAHWARASRSQGDMIIPKMWHGRLMGRAGNQPSRSLEFHNHGEDPYYGRHHNFWRCRAGTRQRNWPTTKRDCVPLVLNHFKNYQTCWKVLKTFSMVPCLNNIWASQHKNNKSVFISFFMVTQHYFEEAEQQRVTI